MFDEAKKSRLMALDTQDEGIPDASSSTQDSYRVAVVDDDPIDFQMLEVLLSRTDLVLSCLDHFACVDDLLADGKDAYDVIIMDRFMPTSGLAETRISEVRARFGNCGVVMNTGHVTHSLRSSAAHQGAMAVIEKGKVDATAFALLIRTAAVLGPSIHMPGELDDCA